MKAIVCEKYGGPDVLFVKEMNLPEPKESEVLLENHAASVNAGDWHLLRGSPFLVRLMFGLTKPKTPVLGSDVAGVVRTVGSKVKDLAPGDKVFGCLSESGFGAFADFVLAPSDAFAIMPEKKSFNESAALPVAALTALQGLRKAGQIKHGQKILINGASGGVGSFAVQIAKSYGAEVTGVCSTINIDLVRKAGADKVIDYKKEDFTNDSVKYDVILDTAAYRNFSDYKKILIDEGTYIMVGGSTKRLLQIMLFGGTLTGKQKHVFATFIMKYAKEDLVTIGKLFETGKLKPFIDKCYSLHEVPEAIRHVESGHPHGKVVICIRDGEVRD